MAAALVANVSLQQEGENGNDAGVRGNGRGEKMDSGWSDWGNHVANIC